MLNGLDLHTLAMPRLINVLAELFVLESTNEKELDDAITKARASIMRRFEGKPANDFDYDSNEEYGMSNDNMGPTSDEPLPYIPATVPTEDGYPGLDPPMG